MSDTKSVIDPGPPTTRNPRWLRDELILALDVYMRDPVSPPARGLPRSGYAATGLFSRWFFRNQETHCLRNDRNRISSIRSRCWPVKRFLSIGSP